MIGNVSYNVLGGQVVKAPYMNLVRRDVVFIDLSRIDVARFNAWI